MNYLYRVRSETSSRPACCISLVFCTPSQRMPPAAHQPQRRVADLTDNQLRHLLLTRLHPTVGVDAWGADRETLLEMALSNGIDYLSAADIEEVGPPQLETSAETRKFEKQVAARMKRIRERPSAGLSPSTKLYAQLFLLFGLLLFQSGRLDHIKKRFGVGKFKASPPPLPACDAPKWWQRPLPRAASNRAPKASASRP